MCILARQIPQVNLPQAKVRILTPLQTRKCGHLSTESDELIHSTVDLLPQLTSFCCTDGIMVILPSLLNLLFGILRECSSQEDDNNQQQSKAISSAILALKKLCSECPHPTKEQKLFEAWESIIRSGLLSLLNFANESHQSGHKEQQLTLLLSAAVILSSASTAKPKTIKNGKEEGDELSTTFRVGQELFEKFCLIQREALIKNDEEDNKGEEKQRIIILKKFILNLCQQIRVGKTDT
uniref:Uncharacterized protein n=1 Tax=Meloidogyne enterolobii TaxID=390850 RepID=A0A6V7WW29_MELEN|nr:unnamed protein product [Meloidogyne enterolobii]CAD2191194.1 unnamed protein product [Meloidogyne enterolobii]